MRFVILMLLLCSSACGQEWHFNVETVQTKTVEETTTQVAEPSADYFIVFVTTNCGPCDRIKNLTIPSVRKAGYKVGIIDISDQPQWGLRNAPHVWRCNDRKRLQSWSGFVDSETLLNSVRPAKTSTVIDHDPATDSAVRHLREVHGIEAGGKTYAELEAIHDADHIRKEGRNAGHWHFPGMKSL